MRIAEIKAAQEDAQAQTQLAHRWLQEQAKDRENEREHIRQMFKVKFTGFIIFWVVIFSVITYWLFLGKDEIASDVIKMLISAAFGAAGGYGWRAIQEKPSDPPDK